MMSLQPSGAFIKSRAAFAAYKCFLILAGLSGIMMQLGVFSGKLELRGLRMFTVLSNCVCVVYLILALAWRLRDGRQTDFCPWMKGICLLSISVTGLVAAVMLPGMINFNSLMGISMLLLHVVMPIGFVLDWLLFDIKGVWKSFSPAVWLAAPYVYFAYIMISARCMTGDMRFPYPFLDYETLGVGRMILILLAMTAFFLLLGYVYYFIDRALASRGKKIKTEK